MSALVLAAFGGLGIIFGRLGARPGHSSGGGSPPAPGTPTYHIYFF